jgi:TM2 domain-containing membrane protein YozV
MARTCPHCGTSLHPKILICDVCHQPLPVVKKEYVTATYDALKPSLNLVTLKSRNIAAFLFLILGFTGVGFYYLSFFRRGFIYFLFNLITIGGVYFFDNALLPSVLLALGGIQALMATIILFRFNIKDHRGELLK